MPSIREEQLVEFSEYFEVDVDEECAWLDPILDTDTRLIVDPFLIFREPDGPWSTAHEELSDYIDRAFRLLSGHEDNRSSLQYRRVVTLMELHEPEEFCLGCVATGTSGSGAPLAIPAHIAASLGGTADVGLPPQCQQCAFEELWRHEYHTPTGSHCAAGM